MKRSNIISEFKPETLHGGTISYSLYINGQKTNVYYFENSPEMWSEAMEVKRLIDAGLIYPKDGNWDMFDICAHLHVSLSKATIVDFEGDWENKLYSRSGSKTEGREVEILTEVTSVKREFTQWIKMIKKDAINGHTILKNIGIKIYAFGYDVFYY